MGWLTTSIPRTQITRLFFCQEDQSTPVHLACAQGDIHMVKLMFDLQPDNREACLTARDVQGMTPLHMATLYDHVDIVNYLLDQVGN